MEGSSIEVIEKILREVQDIKVMLQENLEFNIKPEEGNREIINDK